MLFRAAADLALDGIGFFTAFDRQGIGAAEICRRLAALTGDDHQIQRCSVGIVAAAVKDFHKQFAVARPVVGQVLRFENTLSEYCRLDLILDDQRAAEMVQLVAGIAFETAFEREACFLVIGGTEITAICMTIVAAWIVTVPVSAALAAMIYWVMFALFV